MFSWSHSKGLLCLPFTSTFSVLISYSHCNRSLQTCRKQQELILQFCRLEVQCESHWATVKVLAGLCFFFWGKIHFLAISSCHSSLMTPFSHLQSQQHCISGHSSVQFSRSVVSDSLWSHGLQHARPPCPSPTPGVYPNSCPSSWWCHPTISPFVVPFSSHLQSFPASGSFQMSQLFAWGGQTIGVSASDLL